MLFIVSASELWTVTEIDTGIRKVKGLGAWMFSYVDLENAILKRVMCLI